MRYRGCIIAAFAASVVSGAAAHGQGEAVVAFHRGPTVATIPITLRSDPFLPRADVSWPAYPRAARYRVERSSQATGPWTVVRDLGALHDTVTGLPHGQAVYVRVLALSNGAMEKVAVMDSSGATPVVTDQLRLCTNAITSVCGYQPQLLCTYNAPAARVTWTALSGASQYLVVPYLWNAAHSQRAALASYVVTTPAANDISAPGLYDVVVTPQFTVKDWPLPGQSLLESSTPSSERVEITATAPHCMASHP